MPLSDSSWTRRPGTLAGAQLDGVTWFGATRPDGFVLGYDTGVSCDGHFIDR